MKVVFLDKVLSDISDEYSKDSLTIDIGLGFKNNYVVIYINNIQMVCDALSSGQKIDIAGLCQSMLSFSLLLSFGDGK